MSWPRADQPQHPLQQVGLRHLRGIERDLYAAEEPIFYDLTTSYFEGTEYPISAYGYSSEHRPDKQQVGGGVAVNPDMVPVHHDVYTGDTAQSTTVDEMATELTSSGSPILCSSWTIRSSFSTVSFGGIQ